MCKREAFTLVELLVVTAVIALLMAILLPTLQRAKRQAKAVVCQSNLHQWGLFFPMYLQDYTDMFFTYGGNDDSMARPWPWLMRPYYRDCNDVLLCPMALRRTHWKEPAALSSENPWLDGGKFSAWVIRDHRMKNETIGSYGLNGYLHTRSLVWAQQYDPWRWPTPLVKGAGSVPALLDCSYIHARPRDTDVPPQYDDVPEDGSGMSLFCINRHDGFVNGLFMDWSVRKVGLKESWTLKWHRKCDTAGPWTRAGGVKSEDWPKWMRRFKDY
jgi:prepilin-type N-terminal cleavage/methylation domain-containing protein/prepilin-type processing-associated H-X9-DG protein